MYLLGCYTVPAGRRPRGARRDRARRGADRLRTGRLGARPLYFVFRVRPISVLRIRDPEDFEGRFPKTLDPEISNTQNSNVCTASPQSKKLDFRGFDSSILC